MAKRFAHYSVEEIDENMLKSRPTNTQKVNQKATKAFNVYLTEKGPSEDFETLEVAASMRRWTRIWPRSTLMPAKSVVDNTNPLATVKCA
jgi:hypothetical protein